MIILFQLLFVNLMATKKLKTASHCLVTPVLVKVYVITCSQVWVCLITYTGEKLTSIVYSRWIS